MDLYPTSDQVEIIDAAADFLRAELPAERLPKVTPDGLSPKAWAALAEMGWFAMGISEEDGGLGLSVIEEALVMREFGRQAAPPSILATVLAAHAAASLGDSALTAALAGGEKRACFGLLDPRDGTYRLLDAARTEVVVVWTSDTLGIADRTAFPDQREVESMDATIQTILTGPLPAGALKVAGAGAGVVRRATLLSAALLTGGAEATRDMSAEYAKVRVQYDKPIGAFQSIANKCANMAVACEAAYSLLQFACVAARDEKEQPDFQAAAARVVAAAAAYDGAVDTMQVFGGYGQTYEYLPHFYLKQAILIGALGGGADTYLDSVLAVDSML